MTTSTSRRKHCHHSSSARFVFGRPGLTLIEILIALTMTLIVLGAMAQAFKFASGEIAEGRAILELANRLRNAEQLFRRDMAGLTVEVRPHTEQTPDGYFEYIEGPTLDDSYIGSIDAYLGDVDDILAFTSRSLEYEFRGRFNGNVILSSFAEIIWFTELLDRDSDALVDFSDSVVLNRRVLLIRPDLNTTLTDAGQQYRGMFIVPQSDVESRLRANDISVRVVQLPSGQYLIAANSLQDLARREFRFARSPFYPHAVDRDLLQNTKMGASNGLSGDEILLTDIASFDIKIYSPNTPVKTSNSIAVDPSDVGYEIATNPTALGGFVDLASVVEVSGDNNSDGNPDRKAELTPAVLSGITKYEFDMNASQFWTLPTIRSGLVTPYPSAGGAGSDVAYCTWSPHYENDGIDQDGDGVTDQKSNGLDDDGLNGVDDDGESETAPPYPYPARGIQAVFRVVEKNTKQIRQTSVVHNFSKM